MTAGKGSVLYVTYDGLLDPLGGSQVVPYVEGLARRGYRIHVLSFEKPGELEDRGRAVELRRRLAGAGIGWTPERYHRSPSVPATLWDLARGSARSVAAAARGVRLIHARSYVAGAMGLAARRWTDARLLFDMRGFWVDERIEAGIWSAGSPVVRAARRMERRLLEGSDTLVVLTRRGAEALPELAPDASLPPVRVIPTCVDTGRFRPAGDPAAARERLGLSDGPHAIYAGSLGTWYLAEETFRVGAAFVERSGGGFVVLTREVALARELARRTGVEATVRTVPYREVPGWMAACDAGLALVRPSFGKRASAPTKVGEYLASGLAVAATGGVGDLDRQLASSEVAFTVPGDAPPDAVAGRLLAAVRRPGRRKEARALAFRHYDLTDGVEAYAAAYASLGVEPRREEAREGPP